MLRGCDAGASGEWIMRGAEPGFSVPVNHPVLVRSGYRYPV